MKQIKIRYQFLGIFLLLMNSTVMAQPAVNPQTFCNPLNLNYRFMADAIDAREAADPVVVIYKDDYYLFASRSGGYWTSPDLRSWTFIVPTGIDMETYAPAAVVLRDTLFYSPSSSSRTYKTTDPKSGIWEDGPALKSYSDPDLFLDTNERLYMYYGLSNTGATKGVELDPYTFKELGATVEIVSAQANIHGWERRGDDNFLDEEPWIEGSWMVKENNKYYLHYAGPGTEFKTYSDGIYLADSPLGPFEYATYSPIDFIPTGFISGAGHGCTFKDKNGQYWHIGTMTVSIRHMFERRLGLFPVAIDADGQIKCNTAWGDYPQYFPGVKENPADDNFAGMMVLSNKKQVWASSSLEGYGVEKSVDEEVRTYWCAQTGGTDEWMMIDLGKECSIEAIQVNFGEHATNPDIVRGRDNDIFEQYVIEKSSDGMNWEIFLDKSQNMQDVPHDYIELEQPVLTRYVKLKNIYTPGGGNFAVRDLRIFGNSEQAVFTPVIDFSVERNDADGRDALIKWFPVENADGYIIRYGISPDKLYNNYMVYDVDSILIHSLNHGVDYYFEIKAFDSGTDYYNPEGDIRSFQSGNWNDTNTWSKHIGSEWIHPAPEVPGFTNGNITISEGHIVTVTVNDSVDQLTVASNGILVIDKGVELLVKDGIGNDLMVEGLLKNYGTVTSDTLATISFDKESVYAHEQDGGMIPTATWRPNSTCLIDSLKDNAPINGNQNFYNVTWNCQDQTGDLSLNWDQNTIGGNITIQNTGAGSWQMCEPETGTKAVVRINGDIIQSGGQFTSNGTENANTNIAINHNGNIIVTGGDFSICRGSQGGSGTTVWYLKGNVSLTNCTTQNSNDTGAKFVLTKDAGVQTLIISNVTYGIGGFPIEVDSGSSVDFGTNILSGDGSFKLNPGATILTAHADGLNGSVANTGAKIFDKAANFGFNGSAIQVSGSYMPDTVNNLIISNKTRINLSNSVVVNGTLDMVSGALSVGSNALAYGTNGSLKYSGAAAQTTTSAEFPSSGGPKNLIIGNTGGVTLHTSREIGSLDLYAKLNIGTNILRADSASVKKTNAYISTTDGGALKINSVGASPVFFPVGTTFYTPVWIMNSGTANTISASVIPDTDNSLFSGRLKVKWNIIEESSFGDGDYTLQFGWTASAENTEFRSDRVKYAKIFNMSDTTEAGEGDYIFDFGAVSKILSRSGITKLGSFIVGNKSNITGMKESLESNSRNLILHNNYPNPFNLTTNIDLSLSQSSQVKIVVCDLTGNEITTLLNDQLGPGVYTVQWNAVNSPSGIYVCKLITKNSVQTRMMTLIK